jgi:hypothetical protein
MNPAAQSLGRIGGAMKSEAKTAAARRNGKKGGWPKGRKRGPRTPPPGTAALPGASR